MALQTSGAISLNDIHIEAGGSSGTQASINDSDIRGLIGANSGAQMSFNQWYGATSVAFDASAQSFPSGTNTITGTNATYYEMVATSKAGLSFTLTNVSAGGEIWVAMVGGGGGRQPGGSFGTDYRRGAGGVGMCKITVPNGVSTLTVKVAGAGYGSTSSIAPFGVEPGGGDGGAGSYGGQNLGYNASATGGGYSGIFSGTSITQSNALAIVGGGGGISSQPHVGNRGHGGGLNQDGDDPIPTGGSSQLILCGRKGTLTSGGSGGTDSGSYYATGGAGYALHGGSGGASKYDGGSGGGGGYFGGGGGSGGGGYSGGAGAGGSGYANTSHCSNISNGTPYDGNESTSAASLHYRTQLQSLINSALGDSISLTKDHGAYHGGFVIALPN